MEFDFIVVGAGSAGCVLAARLSENPANRVLLLEAGGKDTNPWIHVPVGYFKTLHNPATDWCYKTAPDPGLNGRQLEWPRGKCLGGSSSINGLLYIRGQQEDYDHWRQLGNTGWSYDDVLPYFKKSQGQERGGDDYHGQDGPLTVSNMRTSRDICDAFIAGAEQIGIPRNDDFNGAQQEGAGYFQLTARNGWRCSSAKAFLTPNRNRPNLTILTKAHTEKLLFEDKRACGVQFRQGDIVKQAWANAGVVLSAGAIGSPQILQVSGVGAPALLADLGIDLVQALNGVGENLQDHLQARAIYKTNQPTLNDEINNLVRRMGIGLEYIFTRRGPMSMGASQVCAFARTEPHLESPDIQFHMQPLSADKPGLAMHPFSAITLSVCQLRPESRGRIFITSRDTHVHPTIEPNYLSTENDQKVLVKGIRVGRKIVRAPAMAEHIKDEYQPGWTFEQDQELLHWARNTATTIYHPTSTCKMGTDPMAVVDSRLKVHGLENLWVADASIMPTIVSGNTNAPSIMIGEKAADMIKADCKG